MENKLHIGVITSCSGRWPRELPEKRLRLYGDWCRKNLGDTEVCVFEKIAGSQAELLEAVEIFRKSAVDLVIQIIGAFTGDDICCGIYEQLRVPVILWAPKEDAWDRDERMYANGLCCASMNGASLRRLQAPHYIVYGNCDDTKATDKIRKIVRAYSAVHALRGTTFGLFGYRPTAFYNCASDEVLLRKTFGIRLEETDLKVLFDQMKEIPEEEVTKEEQHVMSLWDTSLMPPGHLENHCRLYLALKKIYPALGYAYSTIKCWPEMGNAKTQPCAVLGRLADEGIHITCEGDVDAGITAYLEHVLTGKVTFIADLINLSEEENTVTFWHCGNGAPSLHDKEDGVVLADHPLAGQGSAFWCSLKSGVVTAARFSNIDGQYRLFLLPGTAVPTKRNARGCMVNVKTNTPVTTLVDHIEETGMSHHYALVWSDIAEDLRMIAGILGIPVVEL